jgi:hypothetical protein
LHALIAGGFLLCFGQTQAQSARQLIAITNEIQAHPIFVKRVDFVPKNFKEKAHQPSDFILRPFPILTAKGEQSENIDSTIYAVFDDSPRRLDACAVTGATPASILPGPPPITIHNDRNMSGQPPFVF